MRRTTTGGSSTITRRPSRTVVSLDSARRLVRWRALAACCWARERAGLSGAAAIIDSTSRRECHTSKADSCAILAISCAVLRRAALHCPLAIPIGEPGRSGRHHQTGRQPLDVPLPRSGLGFVEVIQIEDLVAFGRGEGAEVVKMRVAADLQLDARGRCAAQIGRHDRRGAPVEGERRRHHPAVADGNEFG